MVEELNVQTDSGLPDTEVTASDANTGPQTRSILPQFALDSADAKIAGWSAAIVDAADTIERLVGAESLPIPDAVRELATSTAQKLRGLGTTAGEQKAAELVATLQRSAAAHPAASIGVGAAVGAALATLLVRLGKTSELPTPTGAAKAG